MLSSATYLLGLLAIALPVIIHLWSKKTRKTVAFGTTKFLEEDDTQTIKSLLPTEWLLLFLRSTIIACLILILSEPLIKREETSKKWTLVDPEYRGHPGLTRLLDSLNGEVRWFSQGFPLLEDSIIYREAPHWKLLNDLSNERGKEIVIISPRHLKNYQGMRNQIPELSWINLPAEPHKFQLGQYASEASYFTITGMSDNRQTTYAHDHGEQRVANRIEFDLMIYADEDHQALKTFIEATLEAIRESSPLNIKLVDEQTADWLIWLSHEPPPSRRKLLFASQKGAKNKIHEISDQVYQLASYDVESYLSHDFPLQLEQILSRGLLEERLNDHRVLPENQIFEATQVKAQILDLWKSVNSWFWGLLILFILLERYLSLRKATPV